jgi:hypothetical protein
MTSMVDRHRAKLAGAQHGGMMGLDQGVLYPTLRQMMEGVRNAKGEEELPQFTLTLFLGEDGLDFVFRQKGDRKKEAVSYFGTVGGAIDVLAEIELALDNGKVRMKVEAGAKF